MNEQVEFYFQEKKETEEDPEVINSKISEFKKADEYERIDCQYCEDVGVCTFCRRGQSEIAELKKRAN